MWILDLEVLLSPFTSFNFLQFQNVVSLPYTKKEKQKKVCEENMGLLRKTDLFVLASMSPHNKCFCPSWVSSSIASKHKRINKKINLTPNREGERDNVSNGVTSGQNWDFIITLSNLFVILIVKGFFSMPTLTLFRSGCSDSKQCRK